MHPQRLLHERDPKVKRLAGMIDRVLVDAPCTGFGTLRRNPDLKWRQTPEALAELTAKQARILAAAATLLGPGGRLVYATCSVLPEENDAMRRRLWLYAAILGGLTATTLAPVSAGDKDKKSDEFTKLLSPNFRAVYSDGIQTKQQEIDSMKKWDLRSFDFSDFNLVMTDADTALMTYQVKIEGTVEGKDASGTYNAASIWQMKKGEWHPIFHTNMKEEKPSS